jgi:hypothetical protein
MITKLSSFTKLAGFATLYTLFFFNTSFAQTVTTFSTVSASYCPYTFTKSLQVGSRDQEVRRLQQILNSDSRTVVAQSGIGSPGNETDLYGVATREAVKKFQALFIEYIGVANGVFGPKTRTVMNAVCNSEYYTSGKGQVYTSVTTQNTINNAQTEVETTTNTSTAGDTLSSATTSTSTVADTLAPAVYLRSNSTSINQGLSFRIIVTASEPIQAFTPDSIIVEGGAVNDLRKLSPNTFSLLVTPNEGAKFVVAQVEADRVLDLAGNKNDNASNEIRIAIIQNAVTVATTTTVVATTSGIAGGELDSIFNRILAQVTPVTSTTTVATTQTTPCSNGATNPPTCNSFVNNYNQTQGYNSGSNSDNQQNSLMNMLLMSRLLGGNNGGGLFGGGSGSSNNSGCSGLSTLLGNCKSPSVTQTGTGGQNTAGSSATDIQACANGDKTKCGGSTIQSNTDSTNTNNFVGGKILSRSECQFLAPNLGGPQSELISNKAKYLRVLSAIDKKTEATIRYNESLKNIDKVQQNTCYVSGNVKSETRSLYCCATVTITNGRYECKVPTELGQTKAKSTYYFEQGVDSVATCSDDWSSTRGNTGSSAYNDPNSLTPGNTQPSGQTSPTDNSGSNLQIPAPPNTTSPTSDDIKRMTDSSDVRPFCRTTYQTRVSANCTSIFGLTARCQNISAEEVVAIEPRCAEISKPW